MLWAAFCLGLFGILRAGEFTCPSQSAVSSAIISVNDVSVNSYEAPSHVMIRVKYSKTDPFDTGFILHVRHTRDELCPVAAMLSFTTLIFILLLFGLQRCSISIGVVVM